MSNRPVEIEYLLKDGVTLGLNKIERSATSTAGTVEGMFKRASAGALAFFSTAKAAEYARAMVRVRGEYQQLEIAFTTMLKSGERAEKLMGGLSEFAATTPFGLQSAASGAKQLIAYGSAAEDVIGELRMLGDVAAGVSVPINDIVYLYGTLRMQGRAYAIDIRQFAQRGIPIYEELAKVLGVAEDQVMSLVSAGKVGFSEVERAFQNMTASGGMYGGLMEAQSKSILGRIERLKDAWSIALNEMGKSSEGVVYKAIDGASSLVENYEKVGKIVAELAVTFGVYKAALVTLNVVKAQTVAFQKLVAEQMVIEQALRKGATAEMVREAATTKALAITKQGLTNNLKTLAKSLAPNPYVLAAVAVAGLALGIYKLATYQTEAEKTTKKLNDAIKEGESARESELYQIDVLFARLKAAKQGTDEYRAAKDAIMGKYGQYLKDLGDEKTALDDIAEAYRVIVHEAREAANARAIDAVVQQSGDIVTEQYSDAFDKIERMLIKKFGEKEAAGYMIQLTPVLRGTGELTSELEDVIRQFDKTIYSAGSPTVGGGMASSVTTNALRARITELAEVRSAADESINNAVRKFGEQRATDGGKAGFDAMKASITELSKELPRAADRLNALTKAGDEPQAIRDQQALVDLIKEQIAARVAAGQTSKIYWEEEKARLEGQLARMDEINRKGAEGARVQAELNNVNARLQVWDSKGAAKEAREAVKSGEEIEKLRRQLAADAAQAEVDAMAEGYLKKRAQADLDFEREKADIVRRQEELKALQGGILTDGQNTQLADLTRAATSKYAAEVRAIDKEYLSWEAEEQAWDEYQIKYGNYQQKRLATTRKYAKLIAEANTAGESMSLERERDAALADLIEYHKGVVDAESDLARKRIEMSGKVYMFQSDREKELLEIQRQRLETQRAMLERQLEIAPSEELSTELRNVNVELDGVNRRLAEMPTQKTLEVLSGFRAIAGELGRMGGTIGDIFSGIADQLDNIMTSFDKSSSGVDKISAGVSGLVNIINMISSASAKRKQAEKEFYHNRIALAHEYALALNEQLRIQSEISGSGFLVDYAGQIDDAFASLTDATDNYRDAIAKLAEGQAKVDLRNAVDWGNVAKGVGAGAAAGAAIGSVIPVIGTAIGAVIGAVGGFFAGLFGGKKKKEVFGGLLEVFPELVDAAGNLNTELAQTIINTDQVDDNTKQLIQNALDWEAQMAAANEQIKDIAVSLAGDLGNALQKSIVDAWRAGEDGSRAMFAAAGESLEGFVEQLLYSTIFSDVFDEFGNKLTQALKGDGDILDAYDWLMGQMETRDDAYLAYLDAFKKRAENRGYDMWQPEDEEIDGPKTTTQSGRAGAYTTMSQDTGSELKGLSTAQLMRLGSIDDKMDALGPGLSEATGVLVEIREEVKTSNGWLKGISDKMDRVIREGLKTK